MEDAQIDDRTKVVLPATGRYVFDHYRAKNPKRALDAMNKLTK